MSQWAYTGLSRTAAKYINIREIPGQTLYQKTYTHNNRHIIIMTKVFRFTDLEGLFKRNAEWAKRMATTAPEVLASNAKGQAPPVLWIGCADSRAGEGCLDLFPGEVFVHRNIANVVSAGDLSVNSVLQFAVSVLKVQHIVVCGHTDCGGVKTALTSAKLGGPMDLWLRQIKEVRAKHAKVIEGYQDPTEKLNKMVELNVAQQVHNVCHNDFVQDAIKSKQLQVHGLVLDVGSGLLKQVDVPEDVEGHAFEIGCC